MQFLKSTNSPLNEGAHGLGSCVIASVYYTRHVLMLSSAYVYSGCVQPVSLRGSAEDSNVEHLPETKVSSGFLQRDYFQELSQRLSQRLNGSSAEDFCERSTNEKRTLANLINRLPSFLRYCLSFIFFWFVICWWSNDENIIGHWSNVWFFILPFYVWSSLRIHTANVVIVAGHAGDVPETAPLN